MHDLVHEGSFNIIKWLQGGRIKDTLHLTSNFDLLLIELK